jgi:uracil-DNA glycosylase
MKKEACTSCRMSRTCPKVYNNSPGWGNPDARLVIVLDDPGHILSEKLLVWMLKRLSLTSDDVWVDYNFRCTISKEFKKKELRVTHAICWTAHPRDIIQSEDRVLVLAGNYAVDFLTTGEMKTLNGSKDPESGAWIVYNFGYLLMNPAECKDTSCVLWKAAEEAGLTPKFVIDIEPFRFPSKKLAGG